MDQPQTDTTQLGLIKLAVEAMNERVEGLGDLASLWIATRFAVHQSVEAAATAAKDSDS
jgi:hypothetical protein